MKSLVAGAAAGLLALSIPVFAQQTDFSKVSIDATDLGHGVYMLQGQGGNMTVAAGRDGAILVDSEFAPLHERIKAAVEALVGKPVRYLVNTHFHGDHTGGNEAFAREGTTVVAHRNVARRLAEGSVNGLNGAKTPPAPKDALPRKTYDKSENLGVPGLKVRLGHPANAHTDGDTYVYFPAANVLATGDIVSLGRYPNIDFANGGSIDGVIAAVDGSLKIANDDTRIVPGHGPLATKKIVSQYRAMLADARGRIAKLIAQGASEQQAVAARPFADLDREVGANEQGSANFVRVIYHSLKPQT